MTPRDPSDALVFFGMSGDLAHKKIFPALYAMVKKGELDVPVIGVASSQWTVDDLRDARARQHHRVRRRRSTTRPRSSSSPSLLRYVDGDYNDAVDVHGAQEGARRARSARRTTSRSRRACSRRWCEGLGSSGCAKNARVIVEKPFGRDLAVGAGAQPGAALGVPRARASSGSTTTSARRRSRTSSTSGSPTRSSSRSGTATTCARCRSRWPRTSACRAAASSTRRSARCATSSQNHLFQTVGAARDGAARRPRRRGAARRQGARVRGDARRSSPTTSCAASSRATATRRASPPTPTSRRSPRCACTSTRGGGPACRSTSAPARSCRSRAPRCGSSCTVRRSDVFAEYEQHCRTTPTTSASSSTRAS